MASIHIEVGAELPKSNPMGYVKPNYKDKRVGL